MRWSHLADLGNKQSGVYSRCKGPVARCSSVCLKTRRLVRPGPWRAQASPAGGDRSQSREGLMTRSGSGLSSTGGDTAEGFSPGPVAE